MQKRIFIRGALAAAVAATVVLISGCGQKAEQPFKVGATAGPHAAIVNAAAEVLKVV